MSEPVRIALVGVGDVAQRDYLPELGRISDLVTLAAVAGGTPTRAMEVGRSHRVPWFTDVDDMFSEVEIDCVLNLTPIPAHYEVSRKALTAGKHVYSEKPIAGSVQEAVQLRSMAQELSLVFVAAPSVMLFPQLVEAGRLIQAGALGIVTSARSVLSAGVPPWEGYMSDPSPYFAEGAGPLVDLGIYGIHAITGLLGPARRVSAISSRTRSSFMVHDGPVAGTAVPVEEDDQWVASMHIDPAVLATVEADFSSAGSRAPQLEIVGTDGAIGVNLLDVSAPLSLTDADGNQREAPIPISGRRAGPDHLLGVEHLVRCVLEQSRPVLSIEHAIHCLEILEASSESAASGRAVDISVNIWHDHEEER